MNDIRYVESKLASRKTLSPDAMGIRVLSGKKFKKLGIRPIPVVFSRKMNMIFHLLVFAVGICSLSMEFYTTKSVNA
jgi:hypothetical protein